MTDQAEADADQGGPDQGGPNQAGADQAEQDRSSRARLATVLGGGSGGIAALILNFVAFHFSGEAYPVQPTSFVAFIGGAFVGMAIADRLGDQAFRIMGITTGLVAAAALTVALLLAG